MIQIEITGATGTGPYDIYVCDITLTYCYLVSSATTIPPTYIVTIPIPLEGVSQVIVKLIDSLGCEIIQLYTCLTPTPTPTNTPTVTPTPTIAQCNCIQFENYTILPQDISYTQCDGTVFYGSIEPSTILYVCGKLPSADPSVIYSVGIPCIDGGCVPIPPPISPTPTPTLTPTPTCSLSLWEIVLSGPATYTRYNCNGSTASVGSLIGGTFNQCSSIQPTSASPNFVSATNIGVCP